MSGYATTSYGERLPLSATTPNNDAPLGYQQLTAITAATALTVPTGARYAVLVAEAQNVRWRDDGTAPTATVGMLLTTSAPAFIYCGKLSAVNVIAATAGAILNVAYYG